jgi:hypothetical protein
MIRSATLSSRRESGEVAALSAMEMFFIFDCAEYRSCSAGLELRCIVPRQELARLDLSGGEEETK